MTRKTRSQIISWALILGMIAVVFVCAFSNEDLADAWDVLFTLDMRFVLGCLGGALGYIVFGGMGLFSYLRRQGYKIRLSTAVHLEFVGVFYANITPGAAGGQPMQAYQMSKRSIPVGVASSALSVRFIATQTMVVLLTAALWIRNGAFVQRQLSDVNALVILGYVINALGVVVILFAMLANQFMQRFARVLIRFLGRIHLLKNPDDVTLRVRRILDNYHQSGMMALRQPFQLLLQLLFAGLEMVSLMSVVVCLYHAFGLTGVPWNELLTVSFMLFVSASYTPLPGASGAQEGGFLLYYRGLFTGGTLPLALLVWRFFTYYLYLLAGVVDMVITALRHRHGSASITYEAPPVADYSDREA